MQIAMFNKLSSGRVRPSDIDGMYIHDDKLFILEVKFKSASMPVGQRMTLERIADAWRRSGKESYVILASHYVSNPSDDVRFTDLLVSNLYKNGRWYKVGYVNIEEVLNRL